MTTITSLAVLWLLLLLLLVLLLLLLHQPATPWWLRLLRAPCTPTHLSSLLRAHCGGPQHAQHAQRPACRAGIRRSMR